MTCCPRLLMILGIPSLVATVDCWSGTTQALAAEPVLIRTIAPPQPGSGFWSGVAVDNTAGRLYVLDEVGCRVDYYDLDGNHLGGWGSQGDGPGQFDWPADIEVSSTGELLIADWNNHRIQVFDLDGRFLRQWGSSGTGPGQFHSPVDLAIDQSGFVYVADSGLDRIQKFTLDGEYLTVWDGQARGPGNSGGVTGVAVAPDGAIVAADQQNLRLIYFDATGTLLRSVSTQSAESSVQPCGVYIDSEGKAFAAGWLGRSACYDAQGNLVSSWTTGSSASRITTDAQGRIYVSGWFGSDGVRVYALPTAVQPTTWSAVKRLFD